GLIWVANAAFTWTSGFAVHYVGYLHNAAQGQPAWSAWWFSGWITIVTPHVTLFVWLTRVVESALAIALLAGFARKTVYVLGALFSLLVWSTAEGFGGPYTVGATNMGAAITYVLIFVALIGINASGGRSPYSIDYFIEKRWPGWRRVAEWGGADTLAHEPVVLPWRMQIPAVLGVVLLLVLLILGLESAFHVRSPSPVAAAAAVTPLSLASAKPTAPGRDARLPPLIGTGNTVDVHLVATDHSVTIANGVDYQAWTFGGTVPGPILHVRQGQTVNVTFTNHGMMKHSLDFHAAVTPPSAHYADIDPGQTITYSFVASTPGAFLYHCGTPPVLLHIANGMYGALIVDPATPLPPASASYVLVQGEWYTQQVSGKVMGANFEKMQEERPDEVVFNGTAFQYRESPLPATAGERIRLYVVNAGPNLWSSFHVIGAIFNEVYPDGDPAHAQAGVSTYTIGPGAGAIFDLVLPQAGDYPFVDHDMAHAGKGAIGVLDVRSANGAPAPKPEITSAPATAAPTATVATAAASAPAGPYKFDAAKGGALFTERCAACHQATGTGIPGAFPPLKGNAAVLDPDPATQIDTILHGLQGQNVGGTVYATPMPPFGSLLSDTEIADIANHERTSWGNQAKQVTADDVKARRAAGGGAKP
ncbi:MAG TPA: multicopper oxidase domain-containing protein, partial [Rhodanobacteraceae bacterium]|nr:multicopper oxidase domain-containing protein [Rhodanobacteraceae bacterium]